MPYINKTRTPHIKIYLKENFKDINDLIKNNQELIVENSIKCYKHLLNNPKKKITLYIQAICKGVESDVELIFSKDNIDDIVNEIIPFYVNIENYEKCQELLVLYNELSLYLGLKKESLL